MRVNTPGAAVLRHGTLFYDRAGRTAEIDGHPLALSSREHALLEAFMRQPGRMLSKAELVERLCERGEALSVNAVEVYVHRLRKKLGAGGVKIYTVRGLGYCLEELDAS